MSRFWPVESVSKKKRKTISVDVLFAWWQRRFAYLQFWYCWHLECVRISFAMSVALTVQCLWSIPRDMSDDELVGHNPDETLRTHQNHATTYNLQMISFTPSNISHLASGNSFRAVAYRCDGMLGNPLSSELTIALWFQWLRFEKQSLNFTWDASNVTSQMHSTVCVTCPIGPFFFSSLLPCPFRFRNAFQQLASLFLHRFSRPNDYIQELVMSTFIESFSNHRFCCIISVKYPSAFVHFS